MVSRSPLSITTSNAPSSKSIFLTSMNKSIEIATHNKKYIWKSGEDLGISCSWCQCISGWSRYSWYGCSLPSASRSPSLIYLKVRSWVTWGSATHVQELLTKVYVLSYHWRTALIVLVKLVFFVVTKNYC